MQREGRYFHLSEADGRKALRLASVVQWSAVLLGLAGCMMIAVRYFAFAGIVWLQTETFKELLNEGASESALFFGWVTVAAIVSCLLVLLPLLYLFRFGRALHKELATGREVMSFGKPLTLLNRFAWILFVEGILLALSYLLGPLSTMIYFLKG